MPASAGPRHARLLRSVLRDYDLGEPDETHAVRLLGSLLHGFVRAAVFEQVVTGIIVRCKATIAF